MANIPVVSNQFLLTHNVNNSGTKSILLSTANTFVDKNIGISIVTPAAEVGAGSASTTLAVNNTDGSAAGINIHPVLSNTSDSEPESGYYVSVDITSAGYSTIDTAGWISTGNLTGGSNTVTKYISIDTSTVTTSYTNSGMSTYFTSGTSSNKNVTITPKYTITAGYSPAVTTATNNGGTDYWKIITATPVADTANVVLYTSDGSNAGTNIKDIVGAAQDTEPNTSDSYYLAFTGSGNSKTTADGWVTAGSFAPASKTKYFPITAAEGTITGTNTVSPSASLDGTNVTLSDTDNGIYITATGGGTASVTAQANITTAGYLPSGNNLFSAALNASSNTTTAKKYISGITVPASKSLTVTNKGTLNVTSSSSNNETATTIITSASTSAGTVTIKAKVAAGDSSTTNQNVVTSGKWVNNTVGSGSSAYTTKYGRTVVKYGAASSNFTNSNLTNYLTTDGASSTDYDVSITPRHTIGTAGYLAAVSNSNGTPSYYKIITASPNFDGGALSGTATASSSTASISDSTNTSGISFTTACTATRADVLYNGVVNGWVSKANDATALSGTSTALTGKTYYINSVTLPKAKSFAVTLTANTTTDNSKLTITNNAYRNVEISNKGNVTITHPTSGSGNVSVTPNGGSSTQIISGGAMVTTSVNTSATTTVSGTTATRATATWGNGWISSGSIAAATFGNEPASGKTDNDYVNISATTDAPVLIAGSYLYINKGFVDNLRISLAKLLPDTMGTGEEGFAAADYILQGYVAFNGEGQRITGTIPTYQGAYSVS